MSKRKRSEIDSISQDIIKSAEENFNLVNVVTDFNTVCRQIDLRSLNLIVDAGHDPKRFAAAKLGMDRPRATLLIFTRARHVCTGSQSVIDACLMVARFMSLFSSKGVSCCHGGININNMVACTNIGYSIDIEAIHRRFPGLADRRKYFPGVIYQCIDPDNTARKLVLLIFKHGKIVLTGGRTRAIMLDILKTVCRDVIAPHAHKEEQERKEEHTNIDDDIAELLNL